MASEEELEGLERAVSSAMIWPLLRRLGGAFLFVATLIGIELGIVAAALIGALSLPAPYTYMALVVYFVVLGSRAWWRLFNFKRRPAESLRKLAAFLKVGSLPLNALLVPAFMNTMPLWAAVVVATLVTGVEFAVWLLIRVRLVRQLGNVMDLLDGGTPRTWEV
jgi:hypothetical protein